MKYEQVLISNETCHSFISNETSHSFISNEKSHLLIQIETVIHLKRKKINKEIVIQKGQSFIKKTRYSFIN